MRKSGPRDWRVFVVVDCWLQNTIFPVGKLFTVRFYTELLGPFPDIPNILLVEYNANTWTVGSLWMRLDNYHSLVQLHKMLLVKLLVLGALTNAQVALIVSLVPRLLLYWWSGWERPIQEESGNQSSDRRKNFGRSTISWAKCGHFHKHQLMMWLGS